MRGGPAPEECTSDTPDVTGNLAGGGHLYLDASYSASVTAIDVFGYAEVPEGTAGVLQLSGPISVRCHGGFRTHPSGGGAAYRDAPAFVVGTAGPAVADAGPLQFTGPVGTYTVSLSLDGQGGGSVSTRSETSTMRKDAHGNWMVPPGCVPGEGTSAAG